MNSTIYLYCSDLIIPVILKQAVKNIRTAQSYTLPTDTPETYLDRSPDVKIPCRPMSKHGRGHNDYQQLMDAKATITNSITTLARQAIQKLEYNERTAEISVFFHEGAISLSADKEYLYLAGHEVPCCELDLTKADMDAAITASLED